MPSPSRRFDAVLFDMDGVLVDSEHRWNDVRIAHAVAGKAAGAYVVLIPNRTMLPAPHAASAADAVIERIEDLDPASLQA